MGPRPSGILGCVLVPARFIPPTGGSGGGIMLVGDILELDFYLSLLDRAGSIAKLTQQFPIDLASFASFGALVLEELPLSSSCLKAA